MNAALEQQPEPDADFAPGSTFGRYRVIRCVGTGGMGAVFEGFHELLSRRVAIKVLHARAAERTDARERFLREAQSVARIRHPHVVDVFDVGVLHDKPYLVMEYLEGESLETALERVGRMDDRTATAILLPIAAALAAVHRHGLVHRDVKPENIFLATDSRGHVVPKLVDFGIAKDLSVPVSGSNHTVVGTPHFMSPEQARGSLTLDARTDEYSFGVLAYQMLTGRMPFDADSLLELVRAIDAGHVVPPRSFTPSIDPRMEAIVLRAMAREASDRFPTMRDVGQALLPFASPRLASSIGGEFDDLAIRPLGEIVPTPHSTEFAIEQSAENTLDEVIRRHRNPQVTRSGTVPVTAVASAHTGENRLSRRKPVYLVALAFGLVLAAIGGWAFIGRDVATPGTSRTATARTARTATTPGTEIVAPAEGARPIEESAAPLSTPTPAMVGGAPAGAPPPGNEDVPTTTRTARRRAASGPSETTSSPAASPGPALHIRLER